MSWYSKIKKLEVYIWKVNLSYGKFYITGFPEKKHGTMDSKNIAARYNKILHPAQKL